MDNIPVVDIGQLGLGYVGDPNEKELQRVGKEISEAFKDFGFVYLDKHGVPEEEHDRLVAAGAAFFDLSQDQKNQWPRSLSKQQGYTATNSEKLQEKYSVELRESCNVHRPDGEFPDSLAPDLRPACTDLIGSCLKLSKRLMVALALDLGLDRDFFLKTHQHICTDNNASALRFAHYPPVRDVTALNGIRCGAHTDFGTFTLIFQNDQDGLYVRDRTGNWKSAIPIPGTVLVIVGDLLQRWTSGMFVATDHKVVIPEDELKRQKCRRSTIFFVAPDDQVVISPINGSKDYEPVLTKQHMKNRFKGTLKY